MCELIAQVGLCWQSHYYSNATRLTHRHRSRLYDKTACWECWWNVLWTGTWKMGTECTVHWGERNIKHRKQTNNNKKKDKKKKFVFTLVEWMDLYLLHADACDNNHHQRIGDERTNTVALLTNRNFYLLLTSLSLQLQFKHPTAPRNAQIFWWKFLMAELLTVHTYLPISIFISFMTHIIRHIRIISVDSHTILSVRR